MPSHDQDETLNSSSDISILSTKRCAKMMSFRRSSLLAFCEHIATSKCHLERSGGYVKSLAGRGVGQNTANWSKMSTSPSECNTAWNFYPREMTSKTSYFPTKVQSAFNVPHTAAFIKLENPVVLRVSQNILSRYCNCLFSVFLQSSLYILARLAYFGITLVPSLSRPFNLVSLFRHWIGAGRVALSFLFRLVLNKPNVRSYSQPVITWGETHGRFPCLNFFVILWKCFQHELYMARRRIPLTNARWSCVRDRLWVLLVTSVVALYHFFSLFAIWSRH